MRARVSILASALMLGLAVGAAAQEGGREGLAACTDLSARETRLACYDRVAGLATPVPVVERVSRWQLRRTRDSITEQSRIVLSVTADRSAGDGSRPELMVRCYDRRLELFVTPAGNGMAGVPAAVTILVDDNDPAVQQWHEQLTATRTSLVAPNAQQLVDRLTRADMLVLEFEPLGQDRQRYSFPVTGLSGLMNDISSCRPQRPAAHARRR